jgi:hypothetical protein
MATYWLTFRIAEDATYSDRYHGLESAISGILTGGKWWKETTSFLLFASFHSLDQVAATVKAALAEDRDVALIGMIDVKGTRIVGSWADADLTTLLPNVQQA